MLSLLRGIRLLSEIRVDEVLDLYLGIKQSKMYFLNLFLLRSSCTPMARN